MIQFIILVWVVGFASGVGAIWLLFWALKKADNHIDDSSMSENMKECRGKMATK